MACAFADLFYKYIWRVKLLFLNRYLIAFISTIYKSSREQHFANPVFVTVLNAISFIHYNFHQSKMLILRFPPEHENQFSQKRLPASLELKTFQAFAV